MTSAVTASACMQVTLEPLLLPQPLPEVLLLQVCFFIRRPPPFKRVFPDGNQYPPFSCASFW